MKKPIVKKYKFKLLAQTVDGEIITKKFDTEKETLKWANEWMDKQERSFGVNFDEVDNTSSNLKEIASFKCICGNDEPFLTIFRS